MNGMNLALNLWNLDWMNQPLVRLFVQDQYTFLYAFGLVLSRMIGLMVVAPLIDRTIIPVRVQLKMALILAVVLAPSLLTFQHPGPLPEAPRDVVLLAASCATELAVGAVLGLTVTLMIHALQFVGHLLDQQAGLGAGEVLNPGWGAAGGATSTLVMVISTTLVFASNAHLDLIEHLLRTFQDIPIGTASLELLSGSGLTALMQMALVVAVRVAIPMLALMSLVSLALLVLQRSTPQLNLFAFGLPVRIVVHLGFVSWMLPGLASGLADGLPALFEGASRVVRGA